MVLTQQDISQLQLRIFRCGDVSLTSSWRREDGRSAWCRLYYITEGSGHLRIGLQTIPLEPGYVYLIPANLQHSYSCSYLKKLYFMFRLTTNERADILDCVDRICRMRYDPAELEQLLNSYFSTDCISVLETRALLFQNICRLLQENNIPSINTSQCSKLVSSAMSYISSNLQSNLTTKAISEHLFVSASKLRSAFYAETGVSIGHYVDDLVTSRAKQLLGETKQTITQISSTLGFCDQNYFSRQFKKKTGMTPSEYRRSLL